jgi:transposase InsO family protein
MSNHRREELVPSADDADVAEWLGQLQDASFGRASKATRTAYPPNRRMTGTQLAGYLARRTYALASTTRPGGRPHATPTLFSLLFSRRLLGFAMSDRHDAELAVASLRMAAAVRGGSVAGVIFHTDQGSEGEFKWSSQTPGEAQFLWGSRTLLYGVGWASMRLVGTG